jgi:glycerate kinase
MRVLVAPDKFRGTLSARQAAVAVATGWRRARAEDEVDVLPMADGGEGTLATLIGGMGGRSLAARVRGPLADEVDAAFGLAEMANGRTAVVEMALASGLELLSPGRRDALRTSTIGTGELIRLALDHRPARILVCVGGSATNDGGVGMAGALGARFLDGVGDPIGLGGRALLDLARIDLSEMDPRLRAVAVTVASDVDNPLTGPRGASAVFGPQKGATPDDVRELDAALGHLAAVVHRDLGVDLRDEPGAGAAGGLGFGLMAFCGAHLRPGVEVVAEAVGLAERMRGADLVLTGEGRFDAQSLRGKVVAGVLRSAAEHGVPAAVVCGDAEAGIAPPGGAPVVSLVERFGREAALADAPRCLRDLAQELAVRLPAPMERA